MQLIPGLNVPSPAVGPADRLRRRQIKEREGATRGKSRKEGEGEKRDQDLQPPHVPSMFAFNILS